MTLQDRLDHLDAQAKGPKRAQTDDRMAEAHSLQDQIALDNHKANLQAQQSNTCNPGVHFCRFKPGGAV